MKKRIINQKADGQEGLARKQNLVKLLLTYLPGSSIGGFYYVAMLLRKKQKTTLVLIAKLLNMLFNKIQVVIRNMNKNTKVKIQNNKENKKAFKPAEFDFISIEKRLKELKELEKNLLNELEKL